jgi:hypothetical protein
MNIMNNSIHARWFFSWLLAVNVAVLVLLGGCASPQEHSFNSDYNESFPTQPMYYVYDADAQHFRIYVHQGTPSTGAEHYIDVKEAASTIAKTESQKRGWDKWQLNYIQQRNQGWMRVVIAEVTRE